MHGGVLMSTTKQGEWQSGLALIGILPILLGAAWLWVGSSEQATARRVADAPPYSAAMVREAGEGATIVIAGRIAPDARVLEHGLAMYVRETYVSRTTTDSDGRRRSSKEWEESGSRRPSFALHASDGPVQVVGEYAMRSPTVDEPGGSALGDVRFEGFRPGDAATVVGTRTVEGVAAEMVFGGTIDELLLALRETGAWGRKWGGITLGLGALLVLPWLLGMVARAWLVLRA
jgi:hypothetical protein